MRILLRLLLLIWIIWLLYRLFSGPRRSEDSPASGRKKIDSTVVNKKDDSTGTDTNQD